MEENKRILVVDDDEGIRGTYQSIFTPEQESDILQTGAYLFDINLSFEQKRQKQKRRKTIDYQLSMAENGNQGIELVKLSLNENSPYAVAFIDMKMPGINGAETSKLIWEIDPKIRIVIVTAYSEYTPDDIIAIAGRDDIFYLRKPFNHEEILQFARALTNEWNLEQKQDVLKIELKAANQALEDMNKNLKAQVEKQAALIVQTDKMASVGLLAAGVAHEINNPLSFINSNLSALKRYMQKIDSLHKKYSDVELFLRYSGLENAPPLLEELENFKNDNKIELIMADINDLTDESLDGIERIKTIVSDLKTFSRIDETEYNLLDINKAIDTTINILWNELKYKTAIVKNYGRIPEIRCFPQKISQVFMNLLLNAAQSIKEQGEIRISTQLTTQNVSQQLSVNKTEAVEINEHQVDQKSYIEIKMSDTGCGIPKDNLNRLFDPFFTTKPVGQGTGLGLSITYEIIKSHKGTIEISSEVGVGTEVTVMLPVGL
ncbi:MAG: response regulator [Desulfamplus sp.]|nr:response regulator [Desulfamplus sp.]